MYRRKPVSNSIKHRPKHAPQKSAPRIIHAKFAGTCPCGKSIVAGEPIFYDRWSSGPFKCLACGQKNVKLQAQKLSQAQAAPDAQQIIDRIDQLKALFVPPGEDLQSELTNLVTKLKTAYATDRGVMSYFRKLVQCRRPNSELVVIRAKFCGFCFHCMKPQKPGVIVLYDRVEKNLHCVECDCLILPN